MDSSDSIALVAIFITLSIAIVGWSKLRTTHLHSIEALRLATSAEQRAQRLEHLQLERRDTAWTQVAWQETDRKGLSFRNSGTDTALYVELVVDPVEADWSRQSEHFESINAGERIDIDLTQQHIDHMIDRQNARLTLPRPQLVEVRIAWRSTLGMPDSQTFIKVQL